MDKLAYGIEEAAEMIGATPTHLRKAVTDRRIRHSRLGDKRGVVFTRAHLQEYLDRNEVEAQQ